MVRIRIFYLVDMIDEACGGAERFAAALAIELTNQGFDITVCATRHLSEQYQAQLTAAGVSTITLNRRAKWDIHRLWRLRRILRESKAQVLHSHKFGSNAWGALLGRIAGVPIIVAHEHTWAYQGDPVRRLVDGHVIGRLSDVFIAVSEDDARRMVTYEKVPAEKIVVLPTASVSSKTVPPAWNVRAAIGLPTESKIVSVAAMMRPQKALHVLIEAMATVIRERPDTHLIVVGDGQCRQSLERLTSELELDTNVHFMGIRDNVLGLLAESECSALSSDYEGMPLFILESLAAGTPIVATDVGAVGRLVRNHETGYVVPPREPKQLAEAIIKILDDPVTRDHMSITGKRLVAQYTIESVSKQFGELYIKIASEKGIIP